MFLPVKCVCMLRLKMAKKGKKLQLYTFHLQRWIDKKQTNKTVPLYMNSGREKKHSVFKQTIIIVLSCFLVTLTTLYNYMGEILFLFCNYLCELPSPQIRE